MINIYEYLLSKKKHIKSKQDMLKEINKDILFEKFCDILKWFGFEEICKDKDFSWGYEIIKELKDSDVELAFIKQEITGRYYSVKFINKINNKDNIISVNFNCYTKNIDYIVLYEPDNGGSEIDINKMIEYLK